MSESFDKPRTKLGRFATGVGLLAEQAARATRTTREQWLRTTLRGPFGLEKRAERTSKEERAELKRTVSALVHLTEDPIHAIGREIRGAKSNRDRKVKTMEDLQKKDEAAKRLASGIALAVPGRDEAPNQISSERKQEALRRFEESGKHEDALEHQLRSELDELQRRFSRTHEESRKVAENKAEDARTDVRKLRAEQREEEEALEKVAKESIAGARVAAAAIEENFPQLHERRLEIAALRKRREEKVAEMRAYLSLKDPSEGVFARKLRERDMGRVADALKKAISFDVSTWNRGTYRKRVSMKEARSARSLPKELYKPITYATLEEWLQGSHLDDLVRAGLRELLSEDLETGEPPKRFDTVDVQRDLVWLLGLVDPTTIQEEPANPEPGIGGEEVRKIA